MRLWLPWCHVSRRDAELQGLGGRLRCNRCARRAVTSAATLGRPSKQRGSACARRPTALPPAAPPSFVRGTCGGIFKRWAGKLAHCFGCGNTKYRNTKSLNSQSPPTPRPPSRAGARKSKQKDQFLAARNGKRLVVLMGVHHGNRSSDTAQCAPGQYLSFGSRQRPRSQAECVHLAQR